MTRRLIFALLALAAAGAAGAFFLTSRPLVVQVVLPQSDVPVRIYGLGTVEARVLSKLGFEVAATLMDLTADAGDSVTEGQVLARLHPQEQEARVARARAAVAAAAATEGKAAASVTRARAVLAQRQAANARQLELAQRSAVSAQTAEESQRDVDVAAADLTLAQSEIGVARAQSADAVAALAYETALLDHHSLTAPYDGKIVARQAEVGTVVRAGDVIFTLIDPATIWVLAFIDEERAGGLALGQPATIRLRSLPHRVFSGTLARIGLESDRVNEERRVWITCADCPSQVYLGEQAEVVITLGTLPEALLVPEVAVSGFDGHQGRVWTLQDGLLVPATLMFGARTDDGRLEVAGGLPPGARVVATPLKAPTEGRAARVQEAP